MEDLKLGKTPARKSVKFKLRDFVDLSQLPKPPNNFGHENLIERKRWGMLGNDVAGDCFTGDTKIPLLNGTEITLKELADKYADKKFWVYSCNTVGKIVPGLAHSPRLSYKNRELLAVTLDNNEVINCTKEHRFLLRDGTYLEAQYLTEGQSLMPVYGKFDKRGYEMTFNPFSNKYHYTHSLMAENY